MALAGASLNDLVDGPLVRQDRLQPVLADCVEPGAHAIEAVVLAEWRRAPRIRAMRAHLQSAFAVVGPG